MFLWTMHSSILMDHGHLILYCYYVWPRETFAKEEEKIIEIVQPHHPVKEKMVCVSCIPVTFYLFTKYSVVERLRQCLATFSLVGEDVET